MVDQRIARTRVKAFPNLPMIENLQCFGSLWVSIVAEWWVGNGWNLVNKQMRCNFATTMLHEETVTC